MGRASTGVWLPLDTTLDNGDTVEILTSRVRYRRSFARLAEASSRARRARNKIPPVVLPEGTRRTEAIEEGRDELTRAMRKRNLAGQCAALTTGGALIRCGRTTSISRTPTLCSPPSVMGRSPRRTSSSHLVKDAGADEVDEEVEQGGLCRSAHRAQNFQQLYRSVRQGAWRRVGQELTR